MGKVKFEKYDELYKRFRTKEEKNKCTRWIRKEKNNPGILKLYSVYRMMMSQETFQKISIG